MCEKYLSVKEISGRLNCAVSTLYRWMDEGSFPRPIKIGSMSRWTESDVRMFLDEAEARRKRE